MEHLKAVGTDPIEWAEKATKHLKIADGIGKRTEGRSARKQNASLHPSFYTKQSIRHTILAAEAFRICGEYHWFASAKAYGLAASLYAEALHDPKEAANVFTESAIVMEKIDTNFANDYYRKAVSQHCDSAQYRSAALMQERMASNFHKKGDDSVAIEEYQRASKLYGAAKMTDDSDRTLEKAAHLLGTLGKYKESALAYQSLVIRNTHENIKKFHAPNIMLRGALLLLHHCLQSNQPNLDEVIQFVEHMYSLDCRFIESPQHDFIADMIQCVRLGELDAFADCVYSFNLFSELDELMLTVLDGIKESISAKMAGKKGMVPT